MQPEWFQGKAGVYGNTSDKRKTEIGAFQIKFCLLNLV